MRRGRKSKNVIDLRDDPASVNDFKKFRKGIVTPKLEAHLKNRAIQEFNTTGEVSKFTSSQLEEIQVLKRISAMERKKRSSEAP